MSATMQKQSDATPELDQLCINTIRALALDAVQKAESGHPGLPLGAAPMAYVLWTRFMRFNPKNPKWENRDRFLLSAGHGCMLLYSLLYLTGYDPSLAGHLKLGKLIYLYDDNHVTIEGFTDLAFSESVPKRFEAYGWHTATVDDGNDLEAIEAAIRDAQSVADRPSLISVKTTIGYGMPTAGTRKAHSDAPGEEAVRETKRHLGWPEDKQFYVPDEALAHFRRGIDRGAQTESEWNQLVSAYVEKHSELGSVFRTMIDGDLPAGWEDHLPSFEDAKPVATRVASGQVINALAPHLPMLIGGSADLGVSNNTDIKDGGSFEAGTYEGRIIHFGVREHAMGATLTGMSLNGGLIPYGGTFMTFSDYMRPSIRLAALSEVQVIYVFTHDSIGLGEDGPTHQPIEHLAALRAIPHLFVVRPADVHEVREAWRLAILRRHAPTALALTRQKVPLIDRKVYSSAEGLRRGGYVLAEADGAVARPSGRAQDERGASPTVREGSGVRTGSGSDRINDSSSDVSVILIATGSEVSLALDARDQLQKDGIATRVVSLPCTELFEEQPQDYRDSVLPPSITARLAIEAGVRQGWDRYVGPKGDVICLDRFGASAPGDVAMKNLGFNVENILSHARAMK